MKITYADKSALEENPDIPNNQKCRANDLNEIKDVVNSNDDLVGDLSSLNTTVKNSLVEAINETNQKSFSELTFISYKSTGNIAPINNWQSVQSRGTKLTPSATGVTVGTGVSYVKVSAWAFNNNNTSGGGFIMGIYKNGQTITQGNAPLTSWYSTAASNQNVTLSWPGTIIPVVEGDVINFGIGINGDTARSFSRGGMLVEEV